MNENGLVVVSPKFGFIISAIANGMILKSTLPQMLEGISLKEKLTKKEEL